MINYLDYTFRNALGETWEALASGLERPYPVILLTRMADQARANVFHWTEVGLQLQAQGQLTYGLASAVVPEAVSRSLVVATVAADIASGYVTLHQRARWLSALVRARDWELEHRRGANRVLETAVSLGGALIKACQFASTRPDLLPGVYIRALSSLQDNMPPRPWPEIEGAITRELGRPPGEVFAEIEETPIAAASIAQVHRARLHDGRQVAVKVQYPDVADSVDTDLRVLDAIVGGVARLASSIQLQPIVDYLKWTLPLELDFKHEAEAMTRLRRELAHRDDVLVPEVIAELSSERLIVMELVEGIKITDRDALEQAGISPHEVAQLLNDLYAEQMLRTGFLHADPHPGNLLVQPGPRLVLLDHGLTIPIPPPLARVLREMVAALAAGDFDALTAALSEAGLQLDDQLDVVTLIQVVGVLLGEEDGGPGSPAAVGVRLGKSIGGIPVDLLLIGRVLGLLDGISRQLDPEMDAIGVVARYVSAEDKPRVE